MFQQTAAIQTGLDKRVLYRRVNDTHSPLNNRRLHEVIESVPADPASIAVVSRHGNWTWSELLDRAGVLAQRLARTDRSNTRVVGVPADPGISFIAGILGTLSAGRSYIPLDTRSPQEWNDSLLDTTGCQYLVRGTRLEIERLETSMVNPNLIGSLPEDVACIVSTSGSSGSPRAVALSHQAILNHLLEYSSHINLDQPQVFLVATSLAYSLPITTIFLSLCYGHRLVLADATDPESLVGLVRLEAPTVIKVPPSVLRRMSILAEREPDLFRSLKTLIVSAEPVHATDLRSWQHLYPELRILVAYGSTEALSTTTLSIEPGMIDGDTILPVGTPSANNRVYVIDSRGMPAGVLEHGEIIVAGVGLLCGYVKYGHLDSSPLSEMRLLDRCEKVFRTGDMGYFQADGNLMVTGRKDRRVKIRGFRVDLQAVEAHLTSCPSTRRAVAWIDSGEGKELLCCAVEAAEHVNAEKIRDWLTHRVPSYMIPNQISVCESIPLTPAGKVDYYQATILSTLRKSDTVADLDNPVAMVITDIWKEIIGVEPQNPDTEFTHAGGDSLHLVDLLLSLEQRFGIQIPEGEALANPTLRALTDAVKLRLTAPERREHGSMHHGLEVTLLQEQPSEDGICEADFRVFFLKRVATLGLSASQQMRLRNLSRAGMDFSYVRLRFPQNFDTQLLTRALPRIVDRYEALRSTLTKEATNQQVLSLSAAATLPMVGDENTSKQLVEEVIERLAGQLLDLNNWPVFRWVLVKTSDGYEFIWQLSHVFVDLFGCDRITRDLITLCSREGDLLNLGGPPLAIEQYLADMATLTWSNELKAQSGRWLEEYADDVRLCERRIRQLGFDTPGTDFVLRLESPGSPTLPVHAQLAVYTWSLAEWLQLQRVPLRIGTSGRIYSALGRNYFDLVSQVNDHFLTTFDILQTTLCDLLEIVRCRMATFRDASLNFDELIMSLPLTTRNHIRIGHLFSCGPLGELTNRSSYDGRIYSVPRPEWGITASRECMSTGVRPTGLAVRLFTYRAKGKLKFHFRFKGIDLNAGKRLIEKVRSNLSVNQIEL